MPAQIIALLAAIAYALGFIFSKRGLRFSTPTTITFVSLLVQTVILFGIVFVYTGIPHTSALVFSLFVVAGILQAIVRQLTYIGIERSAPLAVDPFALRCRSGAPPLRSYSWAKK